MTTTITPLNTLQKNPNTTIPIDRLNLPEGLTELYRVGPNSTAEIRQIFWKLAGLGAHSAMYYLVNGIRVASLVFNQTESVYTEIVPPGQVVGMKLNAGDTIAVQCVSPGDNGELESIITVKEASI